MNNVLLRITASLLSAFLLCLATLKSLGIMQQSGYKNANFLRWLKRKDNLFFNRLSVVSLCLVLSVAVVSLCFSFLGTEKALLISSLPFMAIILVFCYADERYALKVKAVSTGRYKRLFAAYFLIVACVAYIVISLLFLLARWNGSSLYHLIAYVPFGAFPMVLPFLLCIANAFTSVFENIRNKKFIKRAGQVLNESSVVRVGIVGSYGKTSVKNILKTILEEEYTVVETPESYNTPMGIAKTVFSPAFKDKQVFIAEMGARKGGDIAELCRLVKPDYAIFTGVCTQHIQTFGNLENVWQEKKEILKSDAKCVVCGDGIKALVKEEFSNAEKVVFIENAQAKDVQFFATETRFTLCLNGEDWKVKTSLLGEAAIENILLSATLAWKMGLTASQIAKGIEKLSSVPHRLQLLENNGIFILDDSYNCNPQGAKLALKALGRFEGRKCIVTPGIVEGGILQEDINETLGKEIARAGLDKVILVGETLVGALKAGYLEKGGSEEALSIVPDLEGAKKSLADWIKAGDVVLFLNDLPDVY